METSEILYSIAQKTFFAQQDSNNLELIEQCKKEFDEKERLEKMDEFFSKRVIHKFW